MAIQKQTVLSNGVSGNFWKTSRVYVSPDLRGVSASMSLYPNHSAWVSGAPAIDQRQYELTDTQNPLSRPVLESLFEQSLIANNGDFVSGTQVPNS